MIFKYSKPAILAVTFGSLLAIQSPALAAGGGDGGGSNNQCPSGKVWDKKEKKCVEEEASLDQDSLFEAGRALAYAGKYDDAIRVLQLTPDSGDSRVLNMLGYSHRKLGQIDLGIAYYKHAIANEPKYVLVREYYGEALLQKGDVEAAKFQLAAIEKICGDTNCESHFQLQTAIADFEAGNPGKSTARW